VKKKIILIFSLFISVTVFPQKDSIVNYLDRNYKNVKKEQATYIQTIVKKDSLWLGTVYFGNGKMKLQGHFIKKNLKIRTGIFSVFNDKGYLKSIQHYSSDGKKDGIYYYFNDKGERITKGFFLKGKKEGIWKYLDDYKNNRARVSFKKGKVLDYKLWDEEGEILNEDLVLLRKPRYKKGPIRFKAKLNKELIINLRKKGLKTNFLLKCYVDTFGKVQNISITPKLDSSFEQKIIYYFKNFSDLEPGIIANMKVKYPLELPFIFK
jgi:antitoxin component YwqK of YwqJK toxin-antitoxin module